MLFIVGTDFWEPWGECLTSFTLTLALPITQERHTRPKCTMAARQLPSTDSFPGCPGDSAAIRRVSSDLFPLYHELAAP